MSAYNDGVFANSSEFLVSEISLTDATLVITIRYLDCDVLWGIMGETASKI